MDMQLKPSGATEPIAIKLNQCDGANGTTQIIYERDRVRREVSAHLDSTGSGWLLIDGNVVPFYSVCTKGKIGVWMQGRVYEVEHVQATAKRTGAGAATGELGDIVASMPGNILKIEASVGDVFEAHDTLVVMESMKMEMSLSAPKAGRVRKICCQVGDLVEMGDLLVSVEPIEDHE